MIRNSTFILYVFIILFFIGISKVISFKYYKHCKEDSLHTEFLEEFDNYIRYQDTKDSIDKLKFECLNNKDTIQFLKYDEMSNDYINLMLISLSRQYVLLNKRNSIK